VVKKHPNGTMVTRADVNINKMVIEQIKRDYPNDVILGEEVSDTNGNSEYVWVLDPIDGTCSFSHGVPTFVFSLSLCFRGRSVLCVVYDPMLKRLFVAEEGKGCFLNGARIGVNNVSSLSDTVIGTVIWDYPDSDSTDLIRGLKKIGCHLQNHGSTTYMAALTAAGYFGGVIYWDKKIHDTMAPYLLVQEAGGMVTDLKGKPLNYNNLSGFIASNGLIHEDLLRLVSQCLR
jgi:myo-inositol-1(or 4)-monophosphatase